MDEQDIPGTGILPVTDRFKAFCPGLFQPRPGAAAGPLAGRRFVAKDLIDVAGLVTGGGNPDWLATHRPASADAPVVASLLRAGATLVGKTITDELAFSLDGRNAHYGTPVNAAAPGRLPGGSSSGSAAAVAGLLADFALGTDTGGSVRVPAAFCGLFGFRPSHGAVPVAGVIPFAPGFDTVGWFARDAGLLAEIGEVLLADLPPVALPGRACFCRDALAVADTVVGERVADAARLLGAAGLEVGEAVELAQDGLGVWTGAYRTLQDDEIRSTLGPWIRAAKPRFGPNIAPRFAAIWDISAADIDAARRVRRAASARMEALLAEAILILPSAPCVAPLRDIDEAALGQLYPRMLALTVPASLGGLPQVSLPLPPLADGPIGLSLIGPHGSDRALLALAASIAPTIGQPALR